MSSPHKDYLKMLLASVRHPQAASLTSFKPATAAKKPGKVSLRSTASPRNKHTASKRAAGSARTTHNDTSVHRDLSLLELTDPDIDRSKSGLAGDSSLNRTLTEKLKELGPNYDIERRFCVFQAMFTAVISVDSQNGILLKRIKTGYEEYLAHTSHTEILRENEELQVQLLEYQSLLDQDQSEKASLLAVLRASEQSLAAATRQLHEKEALLKVESRLHSEIQTAKQSISRLETEVSLLRKRESLLLGVLKSAQRRGFPVEELLSEAPHRKTASGLSTDFCQAASWGLLLMPAVSGDLQFDQDSPISPIREEGKTDEKGMDSTSSFSRAAEMFPGVHKE